MNRLWRCGAADSQGKIRLLQNSRLAVAGRICVAFDLIISQFGVTTKPS